MNNLKEFRLIVLSSLTTTLILYMIFVFGALNILSSKGEVITDGFRYGLSIIPIALIVFVSSLYYILVDR